MSRLSRLLTLMEPKKPSFIHQVGVIDHELQKAIFNDSERKLLRKVIGSKNKTSGNSKNKAWGRYIQRNTSPHLIHGFSNFYQDPSTLVPANVKRIPYKHFSSSYVKMRAVLELMSTTGLCLFATVGDQQDIEYQQQIIERQIQDFEPKGVQVMTIKPILAQACLWYLSNSNTKSTSLNLDDFWIKGTSGSDDPLSNRLKQLSRNKKHNGQLVCYFFKFDSNSASNLEHLFLASNQISNYLGCHITPRVIKDSQHLEKSFNNINNPSALASENDQHSYDLAKVLQVLASSGMVKSTVGPGGGILLMP